MQTKVLGLIGSPRRKGNTDLLVRRILEGANAAGAVGDLVYLNELAIRECDGCHACWEGKDCAKQDDMNALYPRIIEADAIVFGTPVYWYGPTALMKGFIDRLVYFNCPQNRPKIAGKAAGIVVPFEENDPQTAALVAAFFEKCLEYLQMVLIGRLLVPGVSQRGEVLDKEDRMNEAFDLGGRLAEACGRKRSL
jgi:multimeric flavodoxin WrbA